MACSKASDDARRGLGRARPNPALPAPGLLAPALLAAALFGAWLTPRTAWGQACEAPAAEPADADTNVEVTRVEAEDWAWERDAEVERSLERLLEDRRYRYCHEDGYRLWPHEKDAYCGQASALAERCPELARACERPAFGAQEREREPWNWDWLFSLAPLFRILFWIVVAGGVVLLLRVLWRNLAEEARRRRTAGDLEPELVEWSAEEPLTPRETDVQRLLARARDEAQRGDFSAALASAYAAVLRALERRQLLELHRSRTNGDYLRQLGDHPSERERMRHIVREVETVQFGRRDLDAARFEELMKHVSALVGQVAGWLLLLSLPLWLGGCDSAHFPEGPGASHGPDGTALLETLLQKHSGSAQRRVRRLTGSLDDVSTFVALSPHLRQEEWDLLMTWVSAGGTLVAAGLPEPLAEYLEHQPKRVPCEGELETPGLRLVQAHTRSFADFPDASPLVTCAGAPFLVAADYGAGTVYALADDVWLRNANLAAADNAQIIVRLAAVPGGRVELLGPWTGSGTHHPFESIHNAGLTPLLLQLLLLAIAYAVARGVRFQTPLEPAREERRAFVEHAEALGQQYARSKASGYALEQYGRWALERIRERVPVRDRDLHALAHAVARRTGGEPMAILKILVEAQSAGQIQGAPEEHLGVMQSLSRVLRDVGGS